jgi:eukaryotic-like serine/threonine-protein kinase
MVRASRHTFASPAQRLATMAASFVFSSSPLQLHGNANKNAFCPGSAKNRLPFRSYRHFRHIIVPLQCGASSPFSCDDGSGERDAGKSNDPFRVGDLVNDRFRVVGVLGRGATGVTFDAVDLMKRNAPVALKAIALRGMRNWKVLELFERESRALQQLDHPAIPGFVDSFEVDGEDDVVYVLVQCKASGTSLQNLLESGFRFSPEHTTELFRQLLDVLRFLSELNPIVLHRDVKPANIIVDISVDRPGSNGMTVSLVDFGAVNSGIIRETQDNTLTLIGTTGFMAPEQLGGTADARSDLYACGATMLYVLSGRSPSHVPHKRLRLDVASVVPKEKRVQLGNTYTVMQKLLEPAPEDRYQTARAALTALTAPPTLPRETFPTNSSSGNPRRRRRGLRFDAIGDNDDAFWSDNDSENEFDNAISGRRTLVGRSKDPVMRVRQPAGSNVVIERDANDNLLRVFIPSKGVTGQVLSSGAFAFAWTGFTSFWTLGVLTGGASSIMALFSLPFWFAGAKMARKVADDVRGTTELVISVGGGEREVYFFSLRIGGAFGKPQEVEGDARDLIDAQVETTMFTNGRPVTAMVLREGVNEHLMGETLDQSEQVWLAGEINSFLAAKRR